MIEVSAGTVTGNPSMVKVTALSVVFDQCEIGSHVAALHDPIDHLDATGRPDPARRAFAAGLNRAEFHREARLPRHIHRVVEHHYTTMSDQAVTGRERFVIKRRIEQ